MSKKKLKRFPKRLFTDPSFLDGYVYRGKISNQIYLPLIATAFVVGCEVGMIITYSIWLYSK